MGIFRRPSFLVLVLAAGFAAPQFVLPIANTYGQETLDEKDLQLRLQKHYLSLAESFEFFADPERQQKLTLQTRPIISWTSSERSGFVSGDVFVWTRNGRTELIACFGSLPGDDVVRRPFAEMHALGVEPLPSTQFNGTPWKPQRAGVQFRPVEGNPPGDSATRRLTRMRQISRKFEVQMKADDGSNETLRLLAQPIFRYSAKDLPKDGEVIDGAIFSYVSSLGTDPELLLLLEAHSGNDGPSWRYAPVRFSTREMTLNQGGDKVWHCPQYHNKTKEQNRREPYVTELTDLMRIDGATDKAPLPSR